ncbi:MAG TPA: redoxin domain-containing protein [Caulobacter sp.]|nr:redoxin domain-containing protein [Caulobacter sp.]
MNRLLAAVAVCAALATPALAALKPGVKAPDFASTAFLGGKATPFKLSEALKKGPVVLYFFPAAYTKGCTAEAHEFAEATAEFNAMGATVIGVTAGQTERLADFSKEHCRDKFAVAAVSKDTIKAYDAVLLLKPDLSDRTSYVIAPDGKVIFAMTNLGNPVEHVTKTKAAVKAWRARQPR